MFAATYEIHLTTETDLVNLNGLAASAPDGLIKRPALVGYIGGKPAAALSLADRRIVTDPQRRTAPLVACLRIRADALQAYEEAPSLRARMLAALPATHHASSTAVNDRKRRRRAATNGTTARRPVRRPALVGT